MKYLPLLLLSLAFLTACDSNEDEVDITVVDLIVGTGEEAIRGSIAEVEYMGMLLDSTVFDEGAFAFRVDGGAVIEGFNRGVKGMKEGGKRRITIPPQLGYGDRPMGSIPPNSTLIFEVSLQEVR